MDTFLDIKTGIILTEDYEGTEEYIQKEIKYIPIWKWLLETN